MLLIYWVALYRLSFCKAKHNFKPCKVNNPRLKPWACEENHSPELTHRGKKRLD